MQGPQGDEEENKGPGPTGNRYALQGKRHDRRDRPPDPECGELRQAPAAEVASEHGENESGQNDSHEAPTE
jgi:hypothetical protein